MIGRRIRQMLVAVAVLAGLAAEAEAARRALVVGIDVYRSVTPLAKAVGDAEAISAKLEALGFEVDRAVNPDRRALNLAISTFLGKIAPGDLTLFHFSGHGIEIDGENYLLPVDIPDPKPGEKEFLKSEAVGLSGLTRQFAEAGASLRVFVVDACRDNPFSGNATRSLGGLSRGLARPSAVEGTFILFSAGERQTALDRLGDADPSPTSVFTRVLLDNLDRPAPLSEIAKDVRIEVASLARTVGQVQTPAIYDEVTGRVFLNGEPEAGSSVVTPAPAAPSAEDRDWELARSIGTAEAWKAFRESHPGTFRARLAEAEIAKLSVAAVAPRPDPAPEPDPDPPPAPAVEAAPPSAPDAALPGADGAKAQVIAAVDDDPRARSVWQHNGSELYLLASGRTRSFVYRAPRELIRAAGVERGTVLFDGVDEGGTYRGTAWRFSKRCPPQAFRVAGPVANASRQVRLVGRAPKRDESCRPILRDGAEEVEEQTLIFDFDRRILR